MSSSAIRARVASNAARAVRAPTSRTFVLSGVRSFDGPLGAAHHLGLRNSTLELNVARGGKEFMDILLHRVEAIAQDKLEQRWENGLPVRPGVQAAFDRPWQAQRLRPG